MPHHSTEAVSGCYIQARDGELGHVEDFVPDDDWVVEYLAVDAVNWPRGKKVSTRTALKAAGCWWRPSKPITTSPH